MRTCFSMVPLFLAFALTLPAFAALGGPGFVPAVQQGRGALATSGVRALAAPADARDDMARYSLRAYENRDEANRVRAMLFTPKTVGMNARPMVVYLPWYGGRDEARPSRNNLSIRRAQLGKNLVYYPAIETQA